MRAAPNGWNDDTWRAVALAYRRVRRAGLKDQPAYLAARAEYDHRHPGDPVAASTVSAMIARAADSDPDQIWQSW